MNDPISFSLPLRQNPDRQGGVHFFWMDINSQGFLYTLNRNQAPGLFRGVEKPGPNAIRAFRLDECYQWPQAAFRALQDPGKPLAIDLDNSSVVNWQVAEMGRFNSLIALNLNGNFLSAPGIRPLVELKNLQYLNLERTNITDQEMRYFGQMKKLKVLDISSNNITNKGLMKLSKLKYLTHLKVDGNKITEAGIAKLRKVLKNCEISSE